MNSYCLHLKNSADQLANVESKVSDNRLVLQLIKGLTHEFNEVTTYLEQLDPLPSFYQAQSRLIIHETRRNHQDSREAYVEATTLVSSQNFVEDGVFGSNRGSQQSSQRGCGRRGGLRGKSNGKHRGSFNTRNPTRQITGPASWDTCSHVRNTTGPVSWSPTEQQWSQWSQWYYPPPCPYPTGPSQWPRSSQPPPAGILGPQPQSFVTQVTRVLLHLMVYGYWCYYNMTHLLGTLYLYFNMSNHNSIIVGSGDQISVLGYGDSILSPLHPPHVKKCYTCPTSY